MLCPLKIAFHSTSLAAESVRRFNKLHHSNGRPVVCIYGKWKSIENIWHEDKEAELVGPTVAFNICDRNGSIIGYDEVSRLASLNQPPIQLRTGCFCNPGACQDALTMSDEEIITNWRDGHVCGDRRGIVNGRPTGCIRVSFGKDSSWEDMDALVSFIENVFVSQDKAPSLNENYTLFAASWMAIESMYVFPIKSCAAMKVHSWPIECNTGKLLFDREFALVDASGVAMRLSSHPNLSQIRPSVDITTNVMIVRAPQHDDLILSLEEPANASTFSKDVEVCGILCSGNIWGGRAASKWFTAVLGVRCWLARYEKPDKCKIKTDSMNETQTMQTSYSNETALLLVSLQSINTLNSIISTQGWGKQVDARHFRPNIVVNTNDTIHRGDVHPEDSWEKIVITGKSGEVKLLAAGRCARCQMVDIDPTSGTKGNTLRALAQYRRDRGRIYFGTFFSGVKDKDIDGCLAWLEVGDKVKAV
jgi:molybdenum cofactor sulfurtransferase